MRIILSLLFTITCLPERHAATLRDCAGSNNGVNQFTSLPGMGWDNLLNENRGQVIKYTYSQCKTSTDGRYLIPDNVVVVPLASSSVDIFSEIIDSWNNYTSMTSKSINVGGSVGIPHIFSIHGSFSSEYQKVKADQINDNSMTIRVGARYGKYAARLQSDAPLDDTFKDRVLAIAGHILFGRTNSAKYESQLLVRDFGTHVVTNVESGAAIYKVEQLNRTATQTSDITKSGIAESAGISFFGKGINFNHASTTTDSTVTKYMSLRTHSTVRSHGGPSYKPLNFSINDWVDNIGDNTVAIDRSGDPLNFLVNTNTFPLLPISVLGQVSSSIEDAVATYYKYNTIKGCTDRNSPNFNFDANVDDGSCHEAGENLTFGGVYQSCEYSGDLSKNLCDDITTINPKTGSNTCPEGYEAVMLVNGSFSKNEVTQVCESYYIFWKKCHNVPHSGSASYIGYWCAAVKDKVAPDTGYLFGGLYTDLFSNPLASTHGCPSSFRPLKIASDLSICVSDDYDSGEPFSVPFGGLFSCQQGNPLANKFYTSNSSPKSCPSGYSEHLATIDEGCEINYCAKLKSHPTTFTPVKSPPFIRQHVKSNDNDTFIVDTEGQSWTNINLVPDNFSGFAADVKGWITNDGKDLNVSSLLRFRSQTPDSDHQNNQLGNGMGHPAQTDHRKHTKSFRNMSSVEIAVLVSISVTATLLCVLIVMLCMMKFNRNHIKKTD